MTTLLLARNPNPEPTTPAVALSAMPFLTDGKRQWNVKQHAIDNLWTVGSIQYAVAVDATGNPWALKRTLPDGDWQSYDLSTVAGNPLAAPTEQDSHNSYVIGVDSAGYIHITGNHHNHPLRYVRSTAPGDITSWSAASMVGDETSVSYPTFFKHPDGDLFVLLRQGGSGAGNHYLNRLSNPAAGAWSRVGGGILIDGSGQSAYPNRVVVDSAGTIHLSMTWRADAASAQSSSDLCYLRSTDKGATWRSVTGAAVALPITYSNAPRAKVIPQNTGLLNQSGFDVDAAGRPHMTAIYYDANSARQIFHIYHDGTTWQTQQISAFKESGTDFTKIPNSAGLYCWRGQTFITYYSLFDNQRGYVWMVCAETGEKFPLLDLDLRCWDASFDTQALRDRGELHLQVAICNADFGTAIFGNPYNYDDNWEQQFLGVLTVDMKRLAAVRRRDAKLPRIDVVRTVSSSTYNGATTSTSFTSVPGTAGFATDRLWRRALVFVRHAAWAIVSGGGTATYSLREQEVGPLAQRYLASMDLTGASNAVAATSWVPLSRGPRNGRDGLVDPEVKVTSGATLTSRGYTLEVGVLMSGDTPVRMPVT